MPGRLIALNLILGMLGAVFALLLVREVAFPRRLPPPPAPRLARAEVVPEAAKPAPEELSAYSVIVSRHLFNSGRGGASVVTAGMMPPEARLFLYGVVIDGIQTRAYLSNPVTKRVSSYQVGDSVGGWQVQRIAEDRVVMASPTGGSIEVLLRDPSKPQATPTVPGIPGSPSPVPPTPATSTPGIGMAPRQDGRTELPPRGVSGLR